MKSQSSIGQSLPRRFTWHGGTSLGQAKGCEKVCEGLSALTSGQSSRRCSYPLVKLSQFHGVGEVVQFDSLVLSHTVSHSRSATVSA